VARIIGQYLSERLGQPVIIREANRRWRNIGMASVLSSSSDGYTIGFAAPNNAINQTFYENLSFDFIRDSAPIGGTMLLANVMVVHPDVPAKTVNEFIVYAKANPGRINMASTGHRHGCAQCAASLFKAMTGVNMQHVPYRGSARPTRTCSPIACRLCSTIYPARWSSSRPGTARARRDCWTARGHNRRTFRLSARACRAMRRRLVWDCRAEGHSSAIVERLKRVELCACR